MPHWFANFAVDHEEKAKDSMLNFYRLLLRLRKGLQTHEKLEWLEAPSDVLHYRRPNGWEVAVNFGTEPAGVPIGNIIASSCELAAKGVLPGESAVWFQNLLE